MLEYLYKILSAYISDISINGYVNNSEVFKILFFLCVYDFLNQDVNSILTEDDYNKINASVYKIYGYSLLIPYPEYLNLKTNKIMFTGSISELASRIDAIETRDERTITGDENIVSTIDDITPT